MKLKNIIKNKKIIFIIVFIVLILFLLNIFLPVRNISKENIRINLSTIKPTSKSIEATITTTTNYNIFYFIDYQEEDEYYEETFDTDDIDSEKKKTPSKKEIEIKNIADKEYKKIEKNTLQIDKNCVVYLKYERFGKLSEIPYVFKIDNIDKIGPEIIDISTVPTDSSVTINVEAIDLNSTTLTYYFKIDLDSDYISTGSKNSYTFNNLTTDDTYTIYIKVADEFGNESEAVTDAVISSISQTVEKKLYHFKVNISANTVTVYDKDENGKYTKPIKAMICSTGKATPKSGTYKTSASYRWLTLLGGVYGQYAVRIHGSILFHSVPYLDMYPDTLEYEEFDKLGTTASAGCVRLAVKDAKWIYDNAKIGSSVEFYSDSKNPGPLGKPTAQKISSNRTKRNWDPTDPDQRNPWNGGTGVVAKSVHKNNNINTNTNTISNSVSNNTISNNVISNTTNTTNTTNTVSNNTNSIYQNETFED
jgi:lipoprotein-anchoring transpeptidase ErfK/SrfK